MALFLFARESCSPTPCLKCTTFSREILISTPKSNAKLYIIIARRRLLDANYRYALYRYALQGNLHVCWGNIIQSLAVCSENFPELVDTLSQLNVKTEALVDVIHMHQVLTCNDNGYPVAICQQEQWKHQYWVHGGVSNILTDRHRRDRLTD